MARPLPDVDRPDAKPYWDAARRHELVIQRCGDCRNWIWYPQTVCHACGSWNLGFEPVNGKGTVYSFVVLRHGLHPWFGDRLPVISALVDLDDAPGVRVTAEIRECEPERVMVGMNVEVVFEDVDDRVTLPQFRPTTTDPD